MPFANAPFMPPFTGDGKCSGVMSCAKAPARKLSAARREQKLIHEMKKAMTIENWRMSQLRRTDAGLSHKDVSTGCNKCFR